MTRVGSYGIVVQALTVLFSYVQNALVLLGVLPPGGIKQRWGRKN